jgi:hypothetical protein
MITYKSGTTKQTQQISSNKHRQNGIKNAAERYRKTKQANNLVSAGLIFSLVIEN